MHSHLDVARGDEVQGLGIVVRLIDVFVQGEELHVKATEHVFENVGIVQPWKYV